MVSSSLTVKGGYVNSEEYGLGAYGNKAVLNVSGGVIVEITMPWWPETVR